MYVPCKTVYFPYITVYFPYKTVHFPYTVCPTGKPLCLPGKPFSLPENHPRAGPPGAPRALFRQFWDEKKKSKFWSKMAALAWLACLLCLALAWSGLGLSWLPCLGLVQQQQQRRRSRRRPPKAAGCCCWLATPKLVQKHRKNRQKSWNMV